MTDDDLIRIGAAAQKRFDMPDGFSIIHVSEKFTEMEVRVPINSPSPWQTHFFRRIEIESVRLETYVITVGGSGSRVGRVGYGPLSNTLVIAVDVPPPCPDCGRPMTRREPWTCNNCGEEMDV